MTALIEAAAPRSRRGERVWGIYLVVRGDAKKERKELQKYTFFVIAESNPTFMCLGQSASTLYSICTAQKRRRDSFGKRRNPRVCCQTAIRTFKEAGVEIHRQIQVRARGTQSLPSQRRPYDFTSSLNGGGTNKRAERRRALLLVHLARAATPAGGAQELCRFPV